jgi:hypothetical protein
MILKKKYLINMGAFLSMIPYVSIFPSHTDIQYPIIIICGLIILYDFTNKGVFLNYFEQYFLFLSILSFFYINPFVEFDYQLPKRLALIAAFMIFYVYSRYWKMINPKYLLAAIYLNFIATLVQLTSPDLFEYFSYVMGRPFAINGISDVRGLTGLSAEPAYLGGLSIGYFLVGYVLKNEGRISAKSFYILSVAAIVLNGLSMSGTGIFMLLIVSFSLFLFSHNKILNKIFYALLVMIFVLIIMSYTGISGRNSSFINSFINGSGDFFIADYSAALRAMSLAVGVQTILSGHLLGHGVGTLAVLSSELMENTYLHELLILADGQENNPYSAMGIYLFELGLLFLVMFVWLYSRSLKSAYTFAVRIPIILFIFGAFSMMFPPFWILMAATDKRVGYTNINFYRQDR